MSDGRTIDVGYVHVLTDDGVCRADCPHPAHLPAERALADDLAIAVDLAIPFLAPSVRARHPEIEAAAARYRKARQR